MPVFDCTSTILAGNLNALRPGPIADLELDPWCRHAMNLNAMPIASHGVSCQLPVPVSASASTRRPGLVLCHFAKLLEKSALLCRLGVRRLPVLYRRMTDLHPESESSSMSSSDRGRLSGAGSAASNVTL
jgi:hypothetical protein